MAELNTAYFGTQAAGTVEETWNFNGEDRYIKSPTWTSGNTHIQSNSYLAKEVQSQDSVKSPFDVSLAHCGIGAKGDTLTISYEVEGQTVTETLTADYQHYLRNVHWQSLKIGDNPYYGIDAADGYNANYSSVDIPVWLSKQYASNAGREIAAHIYTGAFVAAYYNWATSPNVQKYNSSANQPNGHNIPLIQYPLDSIVWGIFVSCSNSANTSTHYVVSLANYLDTSATRNYTNYPYVGAVYAQPYKVTGTGTGVVGMTAYGVAFSRAYSITAPYNGDGDTGTANFYNYTLYDSYTGTGNTYLYHYYPIYGYTNGSGTAITFDSSDNYPSGVIPSDDNNVYTRQFFTCFGYDFLNSGEVSKESATYTSSTRQVAYDTLHITSAAEAQSLYKYAMCQMAYLGMFFTPKTVSSVTAATVEEFYEGENLYCGIIDASGLTHGFYTHGHANKITKAYSTPNAQENNPYSPTPFDPTPPKPDHDPNKYINGMPGTNQLSIASFTRLYAMTPNDLTYLRAYLKYIPTQYTNFDAYRDFLGQKFLNSNPIDNMVSLRWYPFDVVENVMVFVPITQPIQISNATAQWTESGSTYTVQGTTSLYPVYYFTLYLGSFTPQTAYGNFLDYEPYSDAKMYLPFCGTASIDLKSILDVTLYVSYKVDVRTGACTAIVAADDYDGNIILTAHGSLAVEVPITGVQSADYQNAVFQAINNLKNAQIAQFTAYVQSATGLIGAAATTAANPLAGIGAAGNAVSGIAGAMQAENNLKQAQYDLKTAQIKHTVVGSTSAGDGSMMYLYPALIVNRPTFIYGYNPDVYAHTVGNACILSDTLESFTGFTVVSAIDLDNVQATETEKIMLRSILAAGIYL